MIDRDERDLPRVMVDRLAGPLGRFLKIEAASGLLLFLSVVAALLLANLPSHARFLAFWETPVGLHFGPFDLSRSLRHWINDGLMTFFFFVVALELKRALVLGELRDPRAASLPLAGAVGGMIVPGILYFALMAGRPGANAWGTVMATDTAFVVGCLALFGARIPRSLRVFALSLAVFDDVGSILVVAVAYGDTVNWNALTFGVLGVVTVAGLARLGVRSIPLFFLLGSTVWLCFDASGIHATIAGVVLGLMTPTRVWVSDARLRGILARALSHPEGEHWSGDSVERSDLLRAGAAVRESLSPLERLEMIVHPWAAFLIMPIFALANAGVAISGLDIVEPVFVAIFVSLVFGKPIGVLLFSGLAVRLGLATRPPGATWQLVAACALLSGIGFTMSLFIAGLAYPPTMLDAAKLGVLAGSLASASGGLLTLLWLTAWKRDA